ncbi:MAG: hypothetical protein ACP5R5_09185 [Armatimonadota bacterium]
MRGACRQDTRPELLILGERIAGVHVVVRRDFAECTVDLIQEESWTMFFSSHIVREVERVADRVRMIDRGRPIRCSTAEELKDSVKRLVLTFDGILPSLSGLD